LTLKLFKGADLIAENDDWGTIDGTLEDDDSFDPLERKIANIGYEPMHPEESVIVITLDPGAYSVFAKGKSGDTGLATADVFEF